jgi:hypothetical protein
MKLVKRTVWHSILFQMLSAGLFEGMQIQGLKKEALSAFLQKLTTQKEE